MKDTRLKIIKNENQSFINEIMTTCTKLDASINNHCISHNCHNCELNDPLKDCRYKSNLLMLLNGYRMATTNATEKAKIDAFLKDNYPSFLVELYKEI